MVNTYNELYEKLSHFVSLIDANYFSNIYNNYFSNQKKSPTDNLYPVLKKKKINENIVFLGSDKMDIHNKGYFPNNILLPMLIMHINKKEEVPMHLGLYLGLNDLQYSECENTYMIEKYIELKSSFCIFHPNINNNSPTGKELETLSSASNYEGYTFNGNAFVITSKKKIQTSNVETKTAMYPIAFVCKGNKVPESFKEMAEFYIQWCSKFSL